MFRDFELERDLMYESKCEFFLNNATVPELQKALPVMAGENNSLILNNKIKIERNIPANPQAPVMYGLEFYQQGCQPLIKYLIDTNFGFQTEYLQYSSDKFPVLKVVADNISNMTDIRYFARQIGPALGISEQWDDPMIRNTNFWQESHIEYHHYKQAFASLQGIVFCIMDITGHSRHLIIKITIDSDRYVLLPLTFAQHPNFSQPMVCHHAFSPDWWLFNTISLKNNPNAEVIICNCWEICEKNMFLSGLSVLGYFWGEGMIPHLHLECLSGRDVKILLLESFYEKITFQNLLEAILLKSKLKTMDIKSEVLLAKKETYYIENKIYWQNALPNAKVINTENLINMCKHAGIDIPENLSPDRLGMLNTSLSKTLIEDFAETGIITAVTIHQGVDISFITANLIRGILQKKHIFADRWKCHHRIIPECFVISSTMNRYNQLLSHLSPKKNFTFRGIGVLKHDDVAKCLNTILHENKSDIFIFSGREIIKEYSQELQETCDWVIRKNKSIVIISSFDGNVAENFIADHAGRNIHIWNGGKKQYEYIIEERPLLNGESSFFKVTYSENNWQTTNVSDEEIRNIEGRNVGMINNDEFFREKSQENKINNYRR